MRNRICTAFVFCCAVLFSTGLFLLPAPIEAKDAKAVELHFDGRPKVGETYVISVNTRQIRTYRMKLVGINNPPRRRETQEIHAAGELIYQSLDPLVIQFKVDALYQIVDGVKTDYDTLAGMTAIVPQTSENVARVSDAALMASIPSDVPIIAIPARIESMSTGLELTEPKG